MLCTPSIVSRTCRALVQVGALVLVLAGYGPQAATAQQMGTTAPPAPRVASSMVWQSYQLADGTRLRQLSLPLSVRVPVGTGTAVSLRANTALTEGPDAPSFVGISDVRLGATTRVPVGRGQVVLGLRVMLPVGTTQWTAERFQTIVRVSRDYLRFRTPAYGQGLSVAPSILYARPLSDRLTAGIGLRYQVRGAYEPFTTMADPFAPGNDLALTGGLDVQLTRYWVVSTDALYTWYAEDKIGGTALFSAGNQLIVGTALVGERGRDTVTLRLRYRQRGQPTLPEAGPAVRTVSDYTSAQGSYRWQPAPGFALHARLTGRWYAASDVTERLRLVDLSLAPSARVTDEVHLRGHLTYTAGTFDGLEAGLGFVAWLR